MNTRPQALEDRNVTKARTRRMPSHEAPPVVPAVATIRHVECSGEPPLEALRNSGMC